MAHSQPCPLCGETQQHALYTFRCLGCQRRVPPEEAFLLPDVYYARGEDGRGPLEHTHISFCRTCYRDRLARAIRNHWHRMLSW